MDNVAVRKAKDLQAAAKQWVESLLGRKLQENEQIAVVALPPGQGQPGLDNSWERLQLVMDSMAKKAKDIPDSQLELAIDEAMRSVRRLED